MNWIVAIKVHLLTLSLNLKPSSRIILSNSFRCLEIIESSISFIHEGYTYLNIVSAVLKNVGQHDHKELKVAVKLCLNLCSFRSLKSTLNLLRSLIRIGS